MYLQTNTLAGAGGQGGREGGENAPVSWGGRSKKGGTDCAVSPQAVTSWAGSWR
jgi:hypothetical protein